MSIEGAAPPSVLLVDEPELHLHPSAQREVRDWLLRRSGEETFVVLATHSPAFLELPTEQACLSLVHLEEGVTRIAEVGDDLIGRLEALGEDLGLGRAGVLQLTRAAVIVEGEHDLKVLQHFLGNELKRERVLMIPLRGARNAEALAFYETGFLARLGVPVRVVFDTASDEGSDMERRAVQEVRFLRERGHDALVIRYEEPDVMCALPETAVRRAYPESRFPGWPELISSWRRSTRKHFKEWALRRIGIDNGPSTFIETVLAACSTDDKPSEAFDRMCTELMTSVP
jgi:hypothetical protein